MKLYHGSISVIEAPVLGKGNPKNDYGMGLYCTEHLSLAKEWACASGKEGFVNEYNLHTDDLSVFDLTQGHILNWMAILLENRTFDLSAGVASAAREYLLATFLPDYKGFDVIRGCERFSQQRFVLGEPFCGNEVGNARRTGGPQKRKGLQSVGF